MRYKHENWYCKPANEAEAREIVERVVASGAFLRDTVGFNDFSKYPWNYYPLWGVLNGETHTSDADVRFGSFIEYTIEQVRELFPLPGEQADAGWNGEGLPPVGVDCEVLHQGRWISATTVGEFGYQRKCMVCAPNGGGFYGFYANEIRPLRTERDQWVEAALNILQKAPAAMPKQFMGMLYDALKSGDLKAPE